MKSDQRSGLTTKGTKGTKGKSRQDAGEPSGEEFEMALTGEYVNERPATEGELMLAVPLGKRPIGVLGMCEMEERERIAGKLERAAKQLWSSSARIWELELEQAALERRARFWRLAALMAIAALVGEAFF